jgi:hypothetical protein
MTSLGAVTLNCFRWLSDALLIETHAHATKSRTWPNPTAPAIRDHLDLALLDRSVGDVGSAVSAAH